MDRIILIILIYAIPCSIVLLIANYIFDKYFKVLILPNKYFTEREQEMDNIIKLNKSNNNKVIKNHNFMIKIYFENEKQLQIAYNDLKYIYNCEVDE